MSTQSTVHCLHQNGSIIFPSSGSEVSKDCASYQQLFNKYVIQSWNIGWFLILITRWLFREIRSDLIWSHFIWFDLISSDLISFHLIWSHLISSDFFSFLPDQKPIRYLYAWSGVASMLDSLNSGDYVDINKLMSGWKRAFGDFSLLLKTFNLYVGSLGDHGTAGEKLLPVACH